MTLPGRKEAFRLYGNQGSPVADILVPSHCEAPQVPSPSQPNP